MKTEISLYYLKLSLELEIVRNFKCISKKKTNIKYFYNLNFTKFLLNNSEMSTVHDSKIMLTTSILKTL